MKKSHLVTLFVAVLAIVFGAASAQAAKVEVCHIPPGNPENWHTISVSTNAEQAHLKHGDLAGSCLENCETLCDDGDACTQDVEADPDQCICLATPQPVDCDDDNPCTADSCDSSLGACVYDTSLPDGDACDDGDPDTTGEVCKFGACEVDNGCPCWTETEIDLIAVGTTECTTNPMSLAFLQDDDELADVFYTPPFGGFCDFESVGPPAAARYLDITLTEADACYASIQSECESRGL